jgi:hypothetical protein
LTHFNSAIDGPSSDVPNLTLSDTRRGILKKNDSPSKKQAAPEEVVVEDSVKGLMERLGNAINQSVSESKEVVATLEEIKQAGYKISLTMEATIHFENGATKAMARPSRCLSCQARSSLSQGFERQHGGACP